MSTYLSITNGIKQLITAISSSAGVADANKIIRTDAAGKIDDTLIPGVAKVNVAQQFVGTQGNVPVNIPYSASVVLDFSLGNIFNITLTGNVTSFDAINLRSANFSLNIIQGGIGGYTITGITSKFKHPEGIVPVLTVTAIGTRSKYFMECDGIVIDSVLREDFR
jgi:hypothetical protein